MRHPRDLLEAVAPFLGWTLVCWVVLGWRLGYPSFWDPDEATYAQASREMLNASNWLVPTYDGRVFFDKPPLFYVLQITSFAAAGANELQARLVPALSAFALLGVVVWVGTRLFQPTIGRNGALMFAVLPATFALSAYAILDMTFTLFLFAGAAVVVVSALDERPGLQYVGYALLAAAVLTKGPLALVLCGLSFLLSLAIAPAARARLLRLRWLIGLFIVCAVSAPWFAYMWLKFGDAFLRGYVLNENIWLYARPLYKGQPSLFFYPKVIATGLLPWTPLIVGRLVDALRGSPLSTGERLLWAWVIAIVGFFSVSSFKLDHYVFPAAPALSLLSAYAWNEASVSTRPHAGVTIGLAAIPIVLVAAGVLLLPGLERVPLRLPESARLLPFAFMAGGLVMFGQVARTWRPLPVPYVSVATMLAAYAVVIVVGLPAFERMKPTRALARIVAEKSNADDHVAMYRLKRWSSSWRFYVGRHSETLETIDELRAFLERPGRHYCAMLRRDYDALAAQGVRLRVIHEEEGLPVTTGRALKEGADRRPDRFLIATTDDDADTPL